MDDLDSIFEQNAAFEPRRLSDEQPRATVNEDILGLEEEIKLKSRKKLVTLNDQKLLSKDGLQYLYDHRKKMKYLKQNKSDYNPKDYTTHYTYKNLTTILEFYQLWAHKLFPKARFADAIMLANRKVAGESRNVKFFRDKLIEQEINELFPEEAIDLAAQRPADVALSDTEMSTERPIEQDVEPSLVPHSNGLFIGDDAIDDDLYTLSNTAPRATEVPTDTATDARNPSMADDVNELDPFSDDDENDFVNLGRKRKTNPVVEEYPEPEDMEQYEEEEEIMREMGM